MLWGFSGVWPGEFGIYRAQDALLAKLQFLVNHGFQSGSVSSTEVRESQRRTQIAQFVAKHDLRLTVHAHLDAFTADRDTLKRETDALLADLAACKEPLRMPIVTFCAGRVHRFMDAPSLAEQLDRLTEALTPLAAGCHELGCPLGIENHGDYYCSDLVELCERVPHLGIFLDTGNAYLIGEQPIPAARDAAPFTIGTHFKDHRVYPDLKALAFVIKGAVLGQGHVGLAEIYRILCEHAPDPADLVMHWELVPPREMGAFEALERSWDFVRSLLDGTAQEVEN